MGAVDVMVYLWIAFFLLGDSRPRCREHIYTTQTGNDACQGDITLQADTGMTSVTLRALTY